MVRLRHSKGNDEKQDKDSGNHRVRRPTVPAGVHGEAPGEDKTAHD